MSHPENVKILAFVGLAGSGKSAAIEYLAAKGFPKVYFGGVIYDAMRQASIDITPESQTKFREEIREREGKDFVVKRIIEQINDLINAGQHRILADGIYSWTEYKIMKKAFPGELTLIAVVTPKKLRHHRLAHRPERPFTDTEANMRDWTEIENLEKGGPIAIADHYIINDGDMEKLHAQVDAELQNIDFYA
ncbi:MAG: putative Dephospho-CoA kinaselike protein [Candidatus Saccharibacteria bacterium]|nr:putative Dephospho-CoA kinaselike protein [Candidatus Saccharibacteria bacterium]